MALVPGLSLLLIELASISSGVWQAKCTIIRETKVYKAKTMV